MIDVMKKIEDKDSKYLWLGHSESMDKLNMVSIDKNHVDHT